jgi:lipopolysaccharide/colanic/teichoic acid biosynthesis glycosyltransferase
MRRLFDIICASCGLLLLSPLLVLIALATKREDGGPVLFAQRRVGRDFREFYLYKFRSMVPHAERFGPALTRPGDVRVTRVGAFLRRHKLDELPQLFNVLKGDMQLVGTRPELARYVERYREQYTLLLRDRPGITDPASLAYRDEECFFEDGDIEAQYFARILPQKLDLAIQYARERTFFSDLCIILRTLVGGRRARRRSEPPSGDPQGGASVREGH